MSSRPRTPERAQLAKELLRLLKHDDCRGMLSHGGRTLLATSDELLGDVLGGFEGERDGVLLILPGEGYQLCILEAFSEDQGGLEELEVRAHTLTQHLAERVALSPHPVIRVTGCEEVWNFRVLDDGREVVAA